MTTITNYSDVRKAAVALLRADSKDTWGLADAVLKVVPDATEKKGFAYDPHAGGVREVLGELAKLLKADDITTPKGDSYTADSLANLREAAMAWPVADRHPEAAYRTHQEAGGKASTGRKVLSALCAISRGETARRPADVDADAWKAAVARVQTRQHGFAVNANDLRTALNRSINNPGRPVDVAAVRQAMANDPEVRAAVAEELVGTPEAMDITKQTLSVPADAQFALKDPAVDQAVIDARIENMRARPARPQPQVDRNTMTGSGTRRTLELSEICDRIELNLDVLAGLIPEMDDETAGVHREWLTDIVLLKVQGCLELLDMRGHEMTVGDFQ